MTRGPLVHPLVCGELDVSYWERCCIFWTADDDQRTHAVTMSNDANNWNLVKLRPVQADFR